MSSEGVAPVPLSAEEYEHLRAEEDAARPVFGGNGANGHNPIGRELPHSDDAEEFVLSACMLDGATVIDQAKLAGITPDSFYQLGRGLVFRALLDLRQSGHPTEAANVSEWLKDHQQLEQVGGYGFLVSVSSRVPTTAQAVFFIQRVREQAALRGIIRAATSTVEDAYAFTNDIAGFGVEIQRRFDNVLPKSRPVGQRMDWDDLLAFDSKHDPDCLMGNRFLGRTSGLVVVAPSGIGKSVLGFQLGACAALQRAFFSLRMHLAMRVLYIQAEDDFGDVAEAVQGFVRGYAIAPEELALLKQRLRIERWNDVSGATFLTRLKRFHAEWPFDLVIANPLFAFAGCNVSEQKELSPFLRNGLNPILNETRSAAILIHHTNKPPQDPSAQDKAAESELRYLGSGSAELTNWARAYITLQGVRAAGDHIHKMVFVKRGNRAGAVDDEGKPTHSIYIEHSKTGLCWLPSEYRPDKTGKFQARFGLEKALAVYDASKHWAENEILIARALEMTPRSVRSHRAEIEEKG